MKLEDKIIAIVGAQITSHETVTLFSNLRQELRLDSFGTLMIINAIEDEFGITVDESDFSQVRTVADIVALLETKYHCLEECHATA
jgi:acyl carrier protein